MKLIWAHARSFLDSSHGVQNTDTIVNVTHKNSLLYNTGANVIPYRHDKLLYG